MLLSFKFNYIPYQIEKNIIWINKIYLYVRTNSIIYIIVTEFLIYLINIYYFIIYKKI